MRELNDQQRQIQELARDVGRREVAPHVAEFDAGEWYPKEHHKLLGDLGLLGGTMPEEIGGAGLDFTTLALILEELGYYCPTTSMICGQPSCSLGEGILRYGGEDLKERYLRPTLAGDLVGAVGVTEAHSGTDISRRIETSAKRDGDDYIVSGSKVWVSNCINADWFLTFATLDRSKGSKGVCAFVIEKAWDGVEVMQFTNLAGSRTSVTGEISYSDVRVPAANLVGEEGKGIRVLMAGSEIGRLACSARAAGQIRACLDASVEYAKSREVFDQEIGRFQMIQDKIATMRMNLEASRLLVWQLAALKDQGHERLQEQASITKLFVTQSLMAAAADAVQIHGAYGCSPEYPVSRYFRDAKFMEIYDGTSEIHKVLIAEHELGYRGARA
jgi:glutaryl-CoA dehydrogenase (non-decarboxylating)